MENSLQLYGSVSYLRAWAYLHIFCSDVHLGNSLISAGQFDQIFISQYFLRFWQFYSITCIFFLHVWALYTFVAYSIVTSTWNINVIKYSETFLTHYTTLVGSKLNMNAQHVQVRLLKY